jgi:hypothetical protein
LLKFKNMMKPKLGSGKRFEKLAEKVEKSYEKKKA